MSSDANSYETLVALFIFMVIAGAAVGLHFFTEYLKFQNIDAIIVLGLKGLEYTVFFADLILCLRFLWKSGYRMWTEM